MFGPTANLPSSSYHDYDSDSSTTLGEDRSTGSSICNSEKLLSPSPPPSPQESSSTSLKLHEATIKRKQENETIELLKGKQKSNDRSSNFDPSLSNKKNEVQALPSIDSIDAMVSSDPTSDPTSDTKTCTDSKRPVSTNTSVTASISTKIVQHTNQGSHSSSSAARLTTVTPAVNSTKKQKATIQVAISPATETLNELTGMDASTRGDLRFDFSQLSQLTNEENESDTNANTNNDRHVKGKNNESNKDENHHGKSKKNNEEEGERSNSNKSNSSRTIPMNLNEKEFQQSNKSNGTKNLKSDLHEKKTNDPIKYKATCWISKHIPSKPTLASKSKVTPTPASSFTSSTPSNKKKSNPMELHGFNSSISSSPATQTLDHLKNADNTDDLRYDLSQLSQLPSNDTNCDSDHDHNIGSDSIAINSSSNSNDKFDSDCQNNGNNETNSSDNSKLKEGNNQKHFHNHSSESTLDESTGKNNEKIRVNVNVSSTTTKNTPLFMLVRII